MFDGLNYLLTIAGATTSSKGFLLVVLIGLILKCFFPIIPLLYKEDEKGNIKPDVLGNPERLRNIFRK